MTRVLGILNCTPDSFSDGGSFEDPDVIARRMWEIAEEGADIVDVGGESTRPGATAVDVDTEWSRIRPALQAAQRDGYPLAVSVDTMKHEVARRALDEGAVIINDVTGLRHDPEIAGLAAGSGAGLIVMHMKGNPRTMQKSPVYDDLIGEIKQFLHDSIEIAESAGVGHESILVDPGIGFGKTQDHNLAILRGISEFCDLGAGVVIGTSRKSFLGQILDLPVHERLEGSLATFAASVLSGAHMVRVHDVREAVRAVRVADAIRNCDEAAE